jgi:hypothetical protein
MTWNPVSRDTTWADLTMTWADLDDVTWADLGPSAPSRQVERASDTSYSQRARDSDVSYSQESRVPDASYATVPRA